MNAFLKLLITNLLFPLAKKFVNWVYTSFIVKDTTEDLQLKQDEREALMRTVKNATSNEERRLLSSAIARFNRLPVDEHKPVQSKAKSK